MSIPRLFRRASWALLALVASAAALDALTYDASAWQADYARLKRDMAQGYANLDWIVEHRHLDIVALDRETTHAIANAHSRVRAFLAIRRFTRAFADPHLRIRLGERPIAANTNANDRDGSADIDPPAGADCAAAGYGEDDHGFRFPFERIAGWTPVADGDFPTGMLGDTGVLRIAQFGEDRYLGACLDVFKPGATRRALQLQVRARQQRLLEAALRGLQARGATRLLVDVSGNGGGTEWVSDVIAMMTDRSLSRQEPRLVGPTCDRAGIWHGKAGCPVLEASAERATLQGSGHWTGPVLILADRNTGSASEDFVVWLQANKVATVIGERTAGAGCGYVDGGTRTRFRASPFDVRMPNCARFMEDGTNEIEGIAPDIAIPMDADDPGAQAKALAAVLARR